jgi:hypothetical protein
VTTRITVTTGDGGLLDRNAQQQAAARQATLLKSQAAKAAALGEEQLRKERIAQGLDPATGLPLPSFGTTSTIRRIDQQPAANTRSIFDGILIWWDNTRARLSPQSAANIELFVSDGIYVTTRHLGQTAFGSDTALTYSSLWLVDFISDTFFAADFTLETWINTGVGGSSFSFLYFFWQDGADQGLIAMQARYGFSGTDYDFSSSLGDGSILRRLEYNSEQGWKHFSYQRIGNDDVFHYGGQRVQLTDGPGVRSPRPITNAQIQFSVTAQDSTTAFGQIGIRKGARYGTGNFIPPTRAFYRGG